VPSLGLPTTLVEEIGLKIVVFNVSIGWHHIIFGRIATSLTTTISLALQEQGIESWFISGEKWSRRLIQIIWGTFLHHWKSRNSIIYDAENGNIMD
jgi:hypothetical protein